MPLWAAYNVPDVSDRFKSIAHKKEIQKLIVPWIQTKNVTIA